jgi:hypothetical protein
MDQKRDLDAIDIESHRPRIEDGDEVMPVFGLCVEHDRTVSQP